MYYVNKEKLEKLVSLVFTKCGMNQDYAKTAAEVLVQADATGVETHGVTRLPLYAKRFESGGTNLNPKIEKLNSHKANIALHGDNGSGLVVGPAALNICIEAAKKEGFSSVTVSNSGHYGCGNYYGNKFAEAGLIGITMTNTAPLMAPLGGKERMIGTNPITIAFPAKNKPPVILDIATSLVSFGKIQVAANLNESIPTNWVNDSEGTPTDDPVKGLDGTLQPMAAHKGYGLALMVDMFCSILAKSAYGQNITIIEKLSGPNPENIGHFMMAISPSTFYNYDEFVERVDAYVDYMVNTEKAKGVERIYVPGEIEAEKYAESIKKGVPVREEASDRIMNLCKELNIDIEGFSTIVDLANSL